ncbi:MAG: cytochrome c oxidase subunit II [Dehalococcoidia bacterium]
MARPTSGRSSIATLNSQARIRFGTRVSGRSLLRRILIIAPLGLSLLLGACSGSPSFLDPQGPRASSVATLWWIVTGMGIVIFVIVVAILLYAVYRNPSQEEQQQERPFGTKLLWVGGITVPLLVFAFIYALSVRDMVASGNPGSPAVTIEVIGHQWWWEVRYPQQRIVTANEIHIPAGENALVKLTSADVLHAFWVPQLHGKLDTVPGQTNSITLKASHPGTFRGECLVYCGLQHATMNFIVVADSPDQFAAWLSNQASTPSTPADPNLVKGQQVFLGSACVYCHSLAGTNASGDIGPNLTHLASRQQLGAGALPNNVGSLGGWIINPQVSKPGNLMPPENFSGPDLQALLAYLESLK